MKKTPQQKKPSPKAKTAAAIADMEPVALMKGQGGNGWFNPASNDQVAWPMLAESDEEKVPRILFKMHAWMMWHTTTKGRRHPYANEAGKALHLENMAADLGYSLHAMQGYWRIGVKRGLWRSGDEEEGTKKLYPCAKITPVAESDPSDHEDGDGNPPDRDLYKSRFAAIRRLSPYLRTELEKQPDEVQERTAIKLERIAAKEKLAHAEVLATLRLVTTEEEDTVFRELGIEKIRYTSEKKKEQPPEEDAAAAERQARIVKLLPHVQGFVQILDGVVQIQSATLYKSDSEDVQNPVKSPDPSKLNGNSNGNGRVQGTNGNAATLSGLDKAKREDETLGRHQSPVVPATPAPSKPHSTKGRSSYTHPGDTPTSAVPEGKTRIDEETREALRTMAEQLEQMQQAYKHTDFGLSDFDPISKSGQQFLLRVVNVIGGPEHVLPYCLFVAGRFKGIDRNALGKLPPRAPGTPKGPRGLGLLLDWAGDYARSLRREMGNSAQVGGD